MFSAVSALLPFCPPIKTSRSPGNPAQGSGGSNHPDSLLPLLFGFGIGVAIRSMAFDLCWGESSD